MSQRNYFKYLPDNNLEIMTERITEGNTQRSVSPIENPYENQSISKPNFNFIYPNRKRTA